MLLSVSDEFQKVAHANPQAASPLLDGGEFSRRKPTVQGADVNGEHLRGFMASHQQWRRSM